MSEHKERPLFEFHFHDKVGQNIANVEYMEVHFDKDMQMQVVNVEKKSGKNESLSPKPPTFTEAIPEDLRIGKLYAAWVGLKEAGILDEDFQLAKETPNTAANYLVTCFCAGGENQWKPFGLFWGIDKLKDKRGMFNQELKDKINAIFSKS